MRFFLPNRKLRKLLFKHPVLIDIRRFYRLLMVSLTAALLLSQLALTSPQLRSALSFVDRTEGLPASAGESVGLGQMVLALEGIEPSSDIGLLENGRQIFVFYDKEIHVTVSDNSVLEIDARRVKTPFRVVVKAKSDNIVIENNATAAEVHANISLLGRIFIK